MPKKIFVANPEIKRQLEFVIHRWEYNITKFVHKEMGLF
jgi:hypothetical protein